MLTSTCLGIEFRNPLVLASGILGVSSEYFKTLEQNGIGGITTKSISIDPRQGHKNPVMFCDEHGFMNAVGLSNAGIDAAVEMIRHAKSFLKVPLIASIFASTPEEFGQIASLISEARPSMIEANISCPNVKGEFGMMFGADPKSAADVTSQVKNNTSIPVTIKLSPNVTNIRAIAKAVEEAGADAITAINTVAGMRINIDARMPILTNKSGGLSGKGIFPIAVKCVYDIYDIVDIPIIGTGGISSGRDAIEMMMAGASLVGIGSALYPHGPQIFRTISDEMQAWLKENNCSLNQIIGAAHGD